MKIYERFKGNTKDESIITALDSEVDVVSKILEEMVTDDENESDGLLRDYLEASEIERSIMDSVLARLCGWTMEMIITLAK